MENTREHMRYLEIGEITEVAEKHIGCYQILNEDQLRYLTKAVSWKMGDMELYPTLPQKAAVYVHYIITGPVFLEGNNRIGLACAILFLEFNGCALRPDLDDAIIELGFKIADGSVTDIATIAAHIEAWIL